MLSRRITRLARKMKMNNPTHLMVYPSTTWVPTNASSMVDLSSQIAQGDDYNNRFSSSIILTRLRAQMIAFAGTTATVPCCIRFSVVRAPQGAVFAANLTGSYSPIVTGTISQLLYDKYYEVGGTLATTGFGTRIYCNIKLRHQQKFSGTIAGTSTGDTLYLIIQSNIAPGTAAPTLLGSVEVFFQPT